MINRLNTQNPPLQDWLAGIPANSFTRGVALRAFNGLDKRFAKRFKLFGDKNLRKVVFTRLCKQFVESSRVLKNP